MTDDSGVPWRVVPDFEQADLALAAEAAARGETFFGTEPYSFWVTQPIELDPITAAQDDGYLRKLVRAPNLPEHIRRGLPGKHGESIAIPDSVGYLEDPAKTVAEQVRTTTASLSEFLVAFGELTLEDRKLIVDQALLLLEENYVHLPLKRAMHAVDPLQQLRLLRYRLDEVTSDQMPPEIEFHAEVTQIFNSLRDLHTGYRLPAPFKNRVAWLPFLIEEVDEGGRSEYVLTKWVADAWPEESMDGAVVTHWNGMPLAITDVSATCHMPDVIEAPYRPAMLGERPLEQELVDVEQGDAIRLGGPSCLAGDVIGDYRLPVEPVPGARFAFLDQAHYSMVKTTTFNGVPLPSIWLWDSESDELVCLRRFTYEDFRGRLS